MKLWITSNRQGPFLRDVSNSYEMFREKPHWSSSGPYGCRSWYWDVMRDSCIGSIIKTDFHQMFGFGIVPGCYVEVECVLVGNAS